MRILCIHFKGGVGKSTTAVHVVGVLLSTGSKVLLLDGDRQVTSFRFFNGGIPPISDDMAPVHLEMTDGAKLSIASINTFESFSSAHKLGKRIRQLLNNKHDHLVVDTTPDPGTANQILIEINPDLVLVPIKQNDAGGLSQLSPL